MHEKVQYLAESRLHFVLWPHNQPQNHMHSPLPAEVRLLVQLALLHTKHHSLVSYKAVLVPMDESSVAG